MIDRYRVERLLGRGAWGTVYLASREGLDRRVAVKVLQLSPSDGAEVLERFKREARAAMAVSHQGVPRVLDFGTTRDGVPWLAMEYLEGETLAAFLQRHTRVSPGVASAVMLPVLAVLDSAHAAGIVHRDLKPSNLMLMGGERREVKVLDFGVAKLVDESLTRPGVAMGTPRYMPPEQAKNAKAATAASDLYSVGVMLFELLAGEAPFRGNNALDLMAQVVTAPAPRLASLRADLDPRLCALVDRLLSKEPSARPSSAAAVREQLAELAPPDVEALWRLGPDPAVPRPRPAAAPPQASAVDAWPRLGAAQTAAALAGVTVVVAAALVLGLREPGGVRLEPSAARPAPGGRAAEAATTDGGVKSVRPHTRQERVNEALAAVARERLREARPSLARRVLTRCVADQAPCAEGAALWPLIDQQLDAARALDDAGPAPDGDAETENRLLIDDAVKAIVANRLEVARLLLDEAATTRSFANQHRYVLDQLEARERQASPPEEAPERRWLTTQKSHQGSPLLLRRPEVLDFEDIGRSFPNLVVIAHRLTMIEPNGLPEADYDAQLADFDRYVTSYLRIGHRGLTVLIETFGGKRTYYCYAADGVALERMKKDVETRYPHNELEWKERRDPDAGFIRKYAAEHF
jgi:eukaryotic-like serine/threonine-protein kinase